MTRFLKTVSLVGACLIAAGALLAVGGAVGGGYRFLSQTQNGFNLVGWSLTNHYRGNPLSAGSQASLAAFHSINVTGPLLDLVLKPSEDERYSIVIESSNDLTPPAYRVENGTLFVESNWPVQLKPNLKGRTYRATILYPAGVLFDSVSIDSAACDLSIDNAQSQNTVLKLDIGDVKISGSSLGQFQHISNIGDLRIEDSAAGNTSVTLNIGAFKGENFDTDGLTVDLNMGDLGLSGQLLGKTEVSVDMGQANLEPTLPEDEYYVELKGMARNDSLGSPNAPNQIHVRVPMGETHVTFNS